MTDFSKIKTIDEAKNAEYGGKKLTRSEEKGIFDDSRLKDSSDSTKIDVSKLRDAAKLLDKVKKARAKTEWKVATDEVLLNEIKKEKTDGTLASKVVNTAKTESGVHLLNDAITHLEGLKVSQGPQDTGDRKGGHTLTEWKAMRDGHKAEVEEAKSRVNEIKEERDNYMKLVSEEGYDYEKAKKYRKNVESLIDTVKSDIQGKQILDSILNRNKNYLSVYESGNCVKTNLAYDGRNYLLTGQVESVVLQIWEQVRLMDETELFNVINSNSFFSSVARTEAKNAYDRMKGRKWGKNEVPISKCSRAVIPWSEKTFATSQEYSKENQLVFNEPDSYVNKPLDKRGEGEIKWPFEKPELRDIAIFMKNIFPYDSNGKLKTGNPILSSNKLRKDEIVKISWFGLRNLPDSSEFVAPSTLRRFVSDLSFTEVSAQIGSENGFFKIFWDLFDDKSLLKIKRVVH